MTDLETLIAAELAEPADPRVVAMAEAIAARYGVAARAVLFYGSCLRTAELDGQMLDFYLIVSDYRAAYGQRWLATANRLVPPNVFPFGHDGLSAKYAVLNEADFAALCRPEASNVSVWARFAQPSRLVWTADGAARNAAIAAIAQAPVTLATLTPAAALDDPLDLWRRGFALTYGAELRAERKDRSGSIVDFDPDHYRRLSAALAAEPPASLPDLDARWRRLRRNGKLLTLVRLAKASLTFAGGIDYLAWKINRHAGTTIEVRPWQRRFPILGALILLPRLLSRGAVR
ncbi:hypothetical protein [Sphingomonas sp. LaA6.9]|uniref:hypothetical protein n=1 Tax=Sphingomonas sp. LaA6.9 TaxID=2919914 RepID=UPI001F4F5C1D|nr:hypothetical protein [Sphingomonas sp. LaA6.9]MCJ8158252.1 hypothetical protein [Sphingomonas sp. LaA6.9]